MFPAIIYPAVSIITLWLIFTELWRLFMSSHGKHSWQYQAAHQELDGQTVILPRICQHPVNDSDTEQLSWFDRHEYMRSTERLASDLTAMLAPSWQELWADVAAVQAYLNSGLLAFPDWLDAVWPHSPENYTCPDRGIKCVCYDIAVSENERIAHDLDHRTE
jgi:hypothetical protein